MKFKLNLILIFLLVSGFFATAQQQDPCGTDALMDRLYQQQPELRKEADKNFAKARKVESELAHKPTSQKRIVPVVVHVVYKSDQLQQKLSVQRIRQQIANLNADFQRLNADTVDTPNVFKPIAGATDFEFRLALIDPSGNPTNGITYTATNVDFSNSGSGETRMKHDSEGGKTAWNVSRYMNIWVTDLEPGLGGYAYLAESAPFVGGNDGIVVKYSLFSANPTFRTLTHETGHYFGLRHTFEGDDCLGVDPSTCDIAGDRICDTPPVSGRGFNKCAPGVWNTCTETPVDMPDNYSNYMDYSNGQCQDMFTKGQVQLMHGMANSIRFALTLNPQTVVGPLNLVPNDAAIFNIISPLVSHCQNRVQPAFRMRNYGTTDINTAVIRYSFDGQPSQTFNYQGSLAPTDHTVVQLPAAKLSTGSHTLNISIDTVNGVADQNSNNSKTSFNFSTADASPTATKISYKQGFECSGDIESYGWTLMNSNSRGRWQRTDVASGHGQSKHSIIRQFHNDRASEEGSKDRLISPLLNLSEEGPDANVYLKYSYAYVTSDNSNTDTLRILVSRACGTIDTLLRTKASFHQTNKTSTLGTAPKFRVADRHSFVPTPAEWLTDSINLKAFIKDEYINIVFETVSRGFSTLYLDDISVISPGKQVKEDCANIDIAEGDFILYPNPVASSGGVFSLETGKGITGQIEVQLFNTSGAAVASYSVNGGSSRRHDFTLPELSVGVYFVRLIQNGEVKETHKLLVRKDW